jgi:1,2-diacylglycerol 3-alpha-glucosyltransferase
VAVSAEDRRPGSALVPTVALACAGLGHVSRGFESFTRECFQALQSRAELRPLLLKGSGPARAGEKVVPTLRRKAPMSKAVARAFAVDTYTLEQATFATAAMRTLAREKVDVVIFSELMVGRVLARLREATKLRYRLLLSNGAPLPPPYYYADHVQQITPQQMELALRSGEPAQRQTALPYGVAMPASFSPPTRERRSEIRARLRLPADREILLSVAAVNHSHKRLGYVIDELSALPAPRPYLLVLGEPDSETPQVCRHAESTLGREGFEVRLNVPRSEVGLYYSAADLFVLASLSEGLGRVLIEAMSHGLPCLAHDYPVTQFVLGHHGIAADLREPGALQGLIRDLPTEMHTPRAQLARHRFVYERFSWDALTADYVALIYKCLNPAL